LTGGFIFVVSGCDACRGDIISDLFLQDKEVGSDCCRVIPDDKYDSNQGDDMTRTKFRTLTSVQDYRIPFLLVEQDFFTGEPGNYPIPVVLLS
jgi:hypothetical protein